MTLDAVAVDNLKLLAQAGLAQDTANPSMALMTANVMLADAIPTLRIIMDHLPSFDPTPDGQAAYEAVVKEMAARPNIFVKLSEVYHPRADTRQVVDDYVRLRDRLEYLYGMFGEDRVIFDFGRSGGDEEILFHQDPRTGREILLEERRPYLQIRQARTQPAQPDLTGSRTSLAREVPCHPRRSVCSRSTSVFAAWTRGRPERPSLNRSIPAEPAHRRGR